MKLLDKMLGRYFLFAIFCSLICLYMNWHEAFKVLIASFFAGGLGKIIWGKEDVATE